MKFVGIRKLKWPCFLQIAAALVAITPCSAQSRIPDAPDTSRVDRTRLPPALASVRFDHLSSGALMLLDRHGDLVRPPASSVSFSLQMATATLDPRVGSNIRLGDDPSALPSGMRAQAEPHIARSPSNQNVVVATFQEGRFTGGGAVDCGYSVTSDGGTNWTRALIPNLTQTSGGQYFRATDPVAGVNLQGDIFLLTEGATDTNFNGGAILLSRSSDGGQTFGTPTVVFRPSNNSVFPDKPWMAINTFAGTPTAGRIVATFTAFTNTSADGGIIARAISDNGGATFGSSVGISSSANNAQSSFPVFLPDGKLVIIYWNFNAPQRLNAIISNDGGNTFGTPKLISNAVQYNEPVIRSGSFVPSVAADRTNGNIYVVYQTVLAGNPKIAFTKSVDGGNTWSSPVAISDNPAGAGVFNPAINVSANGQVLSVAFYDHRDNPGSKTLVDLYLAQSFNGGAAWEPNIRITAVSSDASRAPLTSEGYMLGDYQGIAEAANSSVRAIPVWIDTRTGNPDPFVAQIQAVPSGATPTPTPSATPKPTPSATPTATPTPTPGPAAVMTSPAPGSTFSSSSVTFQWTAGNATTYGLKVGSSPGALDFFGAETMSRSVTVNGIATDGRTIYVALYSKVNNSWLAPNSYTYTAFNSSGTPTPTPRPTPSPTPTPTPTATPTPTPTATPTATPPPANTVSKPTITPASGTYSGSVTVHIFCSTSGAIIHYTLDGSTPTSASPTYPSGGFVISTKGAKTVKAIGTKSGMADSVVATANYTIN